MHFRIRTYSFIIYLLALAPQVSGESDEARLLNDLLVNYSPTSRPVINSSQTVHVNLSLTLIQILSLDEKQEVFTGVLWVVQTWEDEYLKWEPSRYGGLEAAYLKADHIWTPDLYLRNLVGETHNMVAMFLNEARELTFTKHTGKVNSMLPVKVETTCNVNLWYFPFDSQTCTFTFGSWVYPERHVKLHFGADPVALVKDGAWQFISFTPQESPAMFVNEGKYINLNFNLLIRRNPLFYIVNLIIPFYLISEIMLMSLFLPPESGERMSVGLTVFMTYSVFIVVMSSIIPESANSPPVICTLLIVNMVFSLLINAWTVFVIKIHNTAATWGPPPKALMTIMNHIYKPSKKSKQENQISHGMAESGRELESKSSDSQGQSSMEAKVSTKEKSYLQEWVYLTKRGDTVLAWLYIVLKAVELGVLLVLSNS